MDSSIQTKSIPHKTFRNLTNEERQKIYEALLRESKDGLLPKGILTSLASSGPSMVAIALMFIVRPVGGCKQVRPSDEKSFLFTYSVGLILGIIYFGNKAA
ncbi:hypothetical protein CCACVL1_28717 [Corchorus capsularis]|uniref:DUF7769 domain-containing protein n=1 Tax=Corchorus capsularis TaxID=210143 RepID=A0A1R3G5G0_COCAP|nr:hypothetical protein CCACVL1_28717 [Corchorus capsularis]